MNASKTKELVIQKGKNVHICGQQSFSYSYLLFTKCKEMVHVLRIYIYLPSILEVEEEIDATLSQVCVKIWEALSLAESAASLALFKVQTSA